MDPDLARNIAHYSHLDQRDRFGEPVIEHVERVAAAVPDEARAIAFLHDVMEQTGTGAEELRAHGLAELELEVLDVLTRRPDEGYELYCLRIAWCRGEAGVLARAVKLADLDDHLHHERLPVDAPPYAWARRHIMVASERRPAREQAA